MTEVRTSRGIPKRVFHPMGQSIYSTIRLDGICHPLQKMGQPARVLRVSGVLTVRKDATHENPTTFEFVPDRC